MPDGIGCEILIKGSGPVRVGDDFRIQFNSEFYQLLNDMDIVQSINNQLLPWLSQFVQMENHLASRVIDARISESRCSLLDSALFY